MKIPTNRTVPYLVSRRGQPFLVTVATSVALLCNVVTGFSSVQAESLSVEVRAAKLRTEPRTWAPVVSDLNYGDKVDVLGRDSGWVFGQRGESKGYIHDTALTTRQVVLTMGTLPVDSTAQGAEVVLAGKGFAEAVEVQTSSRDQALNFEGVNKLEKFVVQPEDLLQFLRAGNLAVPPSAGNVATGSGGKR